MVLFLNSVGNAQPNMFRFSHITIDQGLSQNTVSAICQDQYGFIWLGSYNGLNRYDGYKITQYLHIISDTNSLSHNKISKIFEDSKGRIWIGTDGGGLELFDEQNQIFIHHKHHDTNPESISSDYINDIFENPKGTLWIATQFGLNKFEEKSHFFQHYFHQPGCDNCLSNNFVTALHSNSPDHLWISTHGGGISRFDFFNQKFVAYNTKVPYTLADDKVFVVHEDNQQRLWIGMESGALNVFHQNTGKFKKYGYSKQELKNQGENLVRNIVPGIGDDFWIASNGGGLYQINHTINYFRVYKHWFTVDESVGNNTITTVYKDRNDVLWVGVANGGVDYIDLHQKPFFKIKQMPDVSLGIKNNVANAILEDRDGNYWIGSEEGLSVSNDNLESFQHFVEKYDDNKTINNNAILCLYEAQNGEIWIGTFLGGVNIYNKKTKTFRYLINNPSDENSLKSNFVRTIFQDSEGLFWLGTINGGLSQYNAVTKQFKHFLNPSNAHPGMSSNNIMKIVEDKNKHIYIATYGGGLNVLNKTTGKFTIYKHHPKDTNTLSNDQIISLAFDSDSMLWLGTTNGLNRFNLKTKKFARFFTSNGLPADAICAIVEDAEKNLWISTIKGIVWLNPKTFNLKSYSKSDGLSSNEFNYNATLLSNDGRIFFGGKYGLNYFYPEDIVPYIREPNIQFTDLFIFNKRVGVNDSLFGRVVLSKPIYQTEKLDLSHKESVFTLYFSSFQFVGAADVKYAYRLLPNDTTWIETGTYNFVSFHNLSYGKHIFELRATNSEGKWCSSSKSIQINIKPPFWRTSIFKIATLLFIILWVYIGIKLRIRSINRQNKLLEEMVIEKTSDLKEINVLLEENQAELEMQHEELLTQSDLANEQNKQIKTQNIELKNHRENLELLVKKRTEELLFAKEKAEKADRLKTAFLANMSHEIRTPMNAILGFIEILDEPEYTKEERINFKGLILNSGQTLLNLINDIIDIAKIETGQIDVYPEPIEFSKIFSELQTIYHQKINDIKPQLSLYLEPVKPVQINTDGFRVNQILINLLDNALKFTDSGYLRFGYRISEKEIVCFVKDTGIGIPANEQPYVFERFNKIENANSKVYRGAGLGLAISKNLIHLLGGKIWVESEEKQGSTFFFTLPL
jgi:signal transduction histidine kinase/ligand-binding sensor domain-containing protein